MNISGNYQIMIVGEQMKDWPPLSENMEDYLEVILELENTKKVARAKDIADRLNIQRGSVTGGLKTLEEKGLINYEPYSFVTLTPKGAEIAGEIKRRHSILKQFFVKVLQVDPQTAEVTACRMEHGIDSAFMDRLINFINFIELCPRTGRDWLQHFLEYCKSGEHDQEKCSRCMADCMVRHDSGAQHS